MELIFSLSIYVYPSKSLIITTSLLGRYRSTKESPDKLGMTDLERRRSGNRSRHLRTRDRDGSARLGMEQKDSSSRDSNLARATTSNTNSRASFVVATVRLTRKKKIGQNLTIPITGEDRLMETLRGN